MQTQIRSWLVTLRRLMLAIALVAGTGVYAAEPDQDAAPKKNPESASPDADKDKPADENPYKIADGKPEETLKAIKELQTRRPQGDNRQQLIEDYKHIQAAIIEAADRLLASQAADAVIAGALAAKLQALGMQGRLGDPAAADQITKIVDEYQKDKRPLVVLEARFYLLQKQVEKIEELAAAERKVLLGELRAYLAQRELDRQSFILAYTAAQTFEQAGENELASEAYREFATLFAKSEDEQLRQYAAKMEGCARRLSLPGNFMEIEGTLVDGGKFDWSAYRGKAVLVDFWATWCGPCRAELPNVKKNYELYHDRGFDVVGVSLDNDRAALDDFLKKEEIPWKTLYSDDAKANGWNHPLAEQYGIMAIPAVFLLDKEGKVVSMNARGPQLGQALEKLLGPAADSASKPPDAEK